MSIALSAEIKPSRIFLFFIAGICLGFGALSLVLEVMLFGTHFSLGKFFIPIITFVAGLRSVLNILSLSRNSYQLDISDSGQIRLRNSLSIDISGSNAVLGAPLILNSDSLLWPYLLVLRVQMSEGSHKSLVVLPDSTSRQNFRAIAVACRWVAAHQFTVCKRR
ncbi:protein YgfX [Herbaspirillum sp. RTI4]|uniref:protein YgfX n=1 Tax=Herbaspirillum sp. RTI4 TaxID=3048640 RepID=UPI002AB5D643|nr:protein YgfX [Herbaspirillum sp. RTI4]MDY7578493.1 protein YgfX [Herbaspirillum sp. RTI4]MEA9981478.1 hypothetical protein [Herbaspirillum sp. RTI4]